MPSIREKYFELLKLNSPKLNNTIIYSLLINCNNFNDINELVNNFDNPCQNIDILDKNLDKILKGKPLQYVLNKAWFCNLEFYVDSRVLIPRSETEQLVTNLIEYLKDKSNVAKNVLDIGTGSGCIAITISKNFPQFNVFASDISKDALDVAKINNDRLNTKVNFIEGNLLEPFLEKDIKFDILISNPPYILNESTVDNMVLDYEPHLALFASPSTFYYEEIFKNCHKILNDTALLAFEIGEDMEVDLTILIKKYFPLCHYRFAKDLYNKTRFMYIEYKKEAITMCDDIKKACEVLNSGGVISFPTETVMGLAVVYDDVNAYHLLNKIKERGENKTYTLMLSNINDIEKYAYVNEASKNIINTFLPGPLTIILPAKDNLPSWVTPFNKTIGIRVPDMAISQTIIDTANKPLLVTSANKSSQPPAMNSQEVKDIFHDEVGYVISGSALSGVPSTIIDLTGVKYKVIREGPISITEIDAVLKGE